MFFVEKKTMLFFKGKFLGQRFMQGNDTGLILIYDSHGTVAGVQMGVS